MAAPARTARARRARSRSMTDSSGRAPIASIRLLAWQRPAPPGRGSERSTERKIPGCGSAEPWIAARLRERGSAAQRPPAAGGGSDGRMRAGGSSQPRSALTPCPRRGRDPQPPPPRGGDAPHPPAPPAAAAASGRSHAAPPGCGRWPRTPQRQPSRSRDTDSTRDRWQDPALQLY